MIDAILDFLKLNGYGIYVWPAFAFCAAVLAWMAVSTVRRLRLNERALAELEHVRARIRAHEAAPPGTDQGDARQ